VPELVAPTTAVHASFLAAMAEYLVTGEDAGYAGGSATDAGLLAHRRAWHTPEGFAAFVRWARERALPDVPRAPGLVPSLELWWVEGADYLGRVSIRTPLTDALREKGGNLGYDVRPSARGRGHGTAMVAAALPHAHALGVDPALLTIEPGNAASLAVARRNGARPAGRAGRLLLLWLPTSGGLSSAG
jgi:predicted acetyltransferase